MAEGVTPEPGTELEQTKKPELEAARSKELTKYTPQAKHGHEHKFHLSYALLAGVGLAGVIAAVMFAIAGKPPKPPEWSHWKPTESGDAALLQIANHIAPNYRLPTGEQLVTVQGGPPQIQGIPVHIVLLRTPTDFSLANGKSALYTLMGLGKFGSITFGKPSVERTLLLRREALELALYTFHYVKDTQQVVVLLPPAKGKKPSQAMYFRQDDLKPQLARPLGATLSAKPPPIGSLHSGPAHDVLDRLTGAEVYNTNVEQAPDASLILELAHFPFTKTGG